MATLAIPSLERRLLEWLRELATDMPAEGSIGWAIELVRQMRANATDIHRIVEGKLADGLEARALIRDGGQMHLLLENLDKEIHALAGSLRENTAAKSFVVELDLLGQAQRATRDLLAEALAVATKPPRPVDWKNLKQEANADHAAGHFMRFGTAEEMIQGLSGGD